jgi:hypothetical protein
VGRLLIGGATLLVFGLLFTIRGIAAGNWPEVGLGVPGLLIGIGSLVAFKLEKQEGTRK